MILTLKITEDSKVELVKDGCEAVQGENNATTLKIQFPTTIKGYSINNYQKQIEFGECKELGECVKFLDIFEGNTYNLCSNCTRFKKIKIQFTLKNYIDEVEPIIWKTIPFELEFCESINAEGQAEIQAQLLSLAEIEKAWNDDLNATKDEWEAFIKTNALRIIRKAADIPTASEENLGGVMLYLGVDVTTPYTLNYAHYYQCTNANNVYSWTDITNEAQGSLTTANAIREINNNQEIKFWFGTKEDMLAETIADNVAYIPTDQKFSEVIDDTLNEMAGDENYNLAYPITKDTNNILHFENEVITRKKILYDNPVGEFSYTDQENFINRKLEITYKHKVIDILTTRTVVLQPTTISQAAYVFTSMYISTQEYTNEAVFSICALEITNNTITIKEEKHTLNAINQTYTTNSANGYVITKVVEIIE